MKGYEGKYEINERGVIRRPQRTVVDSLGRMFTLKEIFTKTRIDHRSGYPVVKLNKKDGKGGTQYIHRLVALTFIPNPDNKPYVNHKDGNRLNCSVENLEWVTPKENYIHGVINCFIKFPYKKGVPLFNRCTGISYPSIKKASKELGLEYNKSKLMVRGVIPNNTCLEKVSV